MPSFDLKTLVKIGFPTAVAIFLLLFLVKDVRSKMDEISDGVMLIRHGHTEQSELIHRQTSILQELQAQLERAAYYSRQICQNTSTNQLERLRCDPPPHFKELQRATTH